MQNGAGPQGLGMEGIIILLVLGCIYYHTKAFNHATADEVQLQKMNSDKREDEQRNMYTLSESHQLLMERVRIEDMTSFHDFVPIEQQYQLQRWYGKVERYSNQYFSSLNVIEQGQKSGDNNVINFAERYQSSVTDVDGKTHE
ncbi:MAG: hypothetical protein ACI8WB_000616 [Phenylobacterium sp.]|jgi:hypothetical protein